MIRGAETVGVSPETVRKVTFDDNSVTTDITDVNNKKALDRDANGNGEIDLAEMDLRGMIRSVKDLLGRITSTAYTDGGDVDTKTDAENNTTDFKIDEAGRDAGRTLADTVNDTVKTYTAEGYLASKTDGNGNTLQWCRRRFKSVPIWPVFRFHPLLPDLLPS